MSFVSLAALALALGYSAFHKAGVPLNEWHMTLIAVGLVGAVHFASVRRPGAHPLDRKAAVAAMVFCCVPAIQLIPMPMALLRIISPARAEIATAVSSLTGTAVPNAPLSVVPLATAGYLLTIGSYLLVFMLVRDLGFRVADRPWLTVVPLLAVGSLEAALGLAQVYSASGLRHSIGTYASYDHFSGLLEMILPFAAMYPVAILVRARRPHESPAGPAVKACGLFSIAALILMAIVHSLSRMGFLASLAAMLVAGSIAVSFRGWRIDYRVVGQRWRRRVPGAIVAIVVLLGFVFLPTDPLIARFSEFARTDDITADTRAQIWRDTTGLIADYLLFGCGAGGYESAFLRYKSVAPMSTVDYAHNDYLQVLAEMGIVGFAAGLFFVALLLFRTVRAILYARSVDERYVAIACTGSFTAILLHSVVDFNMYVPANGFAFAWIAGVAGVHLRASSERVKMEMVDGMGFEPTTPALRTPCSPS